MIEENPQVPYSIHYLKVPQMLFRRHLLEQTQVLVTRKCIQKNLHH